MGNAVSWQHVVRVLSAVQHAALQCKLSVSSLRMVQMDRNM
jgi:hypothetical protein